MQLRFLSSLLFDTLFRGSSQKTAILVAEAGRVRVVAEDVKLPESGHRVIAVDVFYFGESKISQQAFLFALSSKVGIRSPSHRVGADPERGGVFEGRSMGSGAAADERGPSGAR
jgi:hypothetical protein